MSQIDWFKNDLYLIVPYPPQKKKTDKNRIYKFVTLKSIKYNNVYPIQLSIQLGTNYFYNNFILEIHIFFI